VALPPKTSSLRQWALRLGELAQSPEARDELPYWIAAAEGDAGRVPLDLPGGENVVAATGSITVELDEAETHALVHEVPRAYRTQINDALLVALAQSLAAWTGSSAVRFDLEGHGREPLFGEVDLTRTVGWFTSIFPVRIEVASWEAGEALKSVKEQLRRIPNRGITYGLLRYQSSDPSVIERLKQAPQPEVGFNYLGQFADTAKLESSGRMRSARARRRHLIEIDGAIWGGRLRVDWVYSENHHRRATVDRVAEDFIGRLRSLIEHCRSRVRADFTPSDFAQAGISQKDLDKLVAAFAESERQAG
jgi:non-ribosomal peptide synthase protein (TIGR01720 family)